MSRRKKGLTIDKTRGALYKTGRVLGDINAVKRGTIDKRVVRRGFGWSVGRLIGTLMKLIFGGR
jgi:hypothetical protein